MSTFGIILLIIALTSIFMALVLIPIKDGVVSIVFLFAVLVCMLLITVETADTNIKKIDVGETVVVDGIKSSENKVEIVLQGSASHTDISVYGIDIALVDKGTSGTLVYKYKKGRISKELVKLEPMFVPFEYGTKEFDSLFSGYEITVLE
jgi:hypothetical protein